MAHLHHTPSQQSGRITKFHIFVVCLSLILTLTAWQFSKRQVETRTQTQFMIARDQTLALITDRMSKYEDALWSGVAAIESHSEAITYAEWHTFAASLRIEDRYPGINGIGLIYFKTSDQLDTFLAEQRQERPEFNIFPSHDNAILMPITFIEPESMNAAAIGLDVAHETNRRTAALASRDTGTAQITGPIVLVQDADSTPGFLFYAPIYQNGPQPDIASRREHVIGAVYAPFVAHKLMEGLLAKENRNIRFSIRDGEEALYDEHQPDAAAYDPKPLFTEKVSLKIYGREWIIDIRTNLDFRKSVTLTQPTVILIVGLIIEMLIIALLVLMSRANSRAISYADKVTMALRRESAKLTETNEKLNQRNEEVAQFSYVASHDLRTPIRGIGGLAEMLEEDLSDYFNDPSANPEVRENLDHIRERVERMEDLTRGILDFSQVDVAPLDDRAIPLSEMARSLILDFGLAPSQLEVTGNVTTIQRDTANFRRVLENLIGNAIKYHEGTGPLHLTVTAQSDDDRCLMTVSDNGPGIDPKYQDRIFDVFQTLRRPGAAESTGIGLAIVKKAVERHGGEIGVSSVLGEGATFTFCWPNTPQTQFPSENLSAA